MAPILKVRRQLGLEDLPLLIEIVDSEEKINGFLPALEEMMGSGLVTLEKVKVLRYGER